MSRQSLSLIVLAAGIGRRFGGLKQAEPIGPGGELIVDYSIYDALRAGFEHVVLVIREDLREAFQERFDRVLRSRCAVDYVLQSMEDLPPGYAIPPGRTKPWGTGHALLCCKDVVHGAFAVINGDDYYGAESYRILAEALSSEQDGANAIGAVVGFPLNGTLSDHGTVSRGVCQVDEGGWLKMIHERKRVKRVGGSAAYLDERKRWRPLLDDAVASMNMWGLPAPFLRACDERFPGFLKNRADDLETAEFLLPEIVGEMLGEGKLAIRVLPSSERWFGITHRDDLTAVRAGIQDHIAAGRYPECLWE